MREIRQSGSVRGVRRDPYPYRDYTAADGTLPNGDQKTISLGELRIVQAVKQILNVNLKRAGR
jgi:hypothetical protein